MAKRLTDTTIWKKQRWFKKLSPIHKLAWKYITDTCDHAGIYKIDFSEFIDDLGVEDFDIQNFIEACNIDYNKTDGKKIKRERIKLVDECTFWITGFVKFQYEGKDFYVNPSVPAIYSALTVLNGYGILGEGLSKGYFTLSKPYKKGMLRTKDKDKDKNNNNKKGMQDFVLYKLYEKSFQEAKKIFTEMTEKEFNDWKYFVDFVYKKNYSEIFSYRALNPVDFSKIKDFPEEKWDEVLQLILGTGIKEEHNLLFRIPQFIKITEKGKTNGYTKNNKVGQDIVFDKL